MGFLTGLLGRKVRKAPAVRLPVTPRHIAIVMDGNGRWAERRHLPRSAGHRAGLERIQDVLRACIEQKIEFVTLYAFSTENWRRSPEEVSFLMRLFGEAMVGHASELDRQGVRLRFIGRRDRLPGELVSAMEEMERKTAGNTVITLVMAIDYGARDEIIRAVRQLARLGREGRLDPESLDERRLAAELYTADLPDPDLVIRTSGEIRLSNFLLWQAAYAELWFTTVLWPDFGRPQLLEALQDYASRERRYGGAERTDRPRRVGDG